MYSQNCRLFRLELVEISVESGDLLGHTLSLSGGHNSLVLCVALLEGVAGHDLPVVEDALREGLTSSVGSEIGSETKGFHDGKVGLDVGEGSSDSLDLLDDLSSSLVHDSVDSSNDSLGAGDLDQEDGLHESGLSSQLGGVEDTSGSGDDLTTSSVDGISVEDNVVDVESDSSHVLSGQDSLLGDPLVGSDNRVLNLRKVLNSLGDVDANIGSIGVGSKTPDLSGLSNVPAVLLSELSSSELEVVLGIDVSIVDGLRETLGEGRSSDVESVVLVGRLGQTDLVGVGSNSLSE